MARRVIQEKDSDLTAVADHPRPEVAKILSEEAFSRIADTPLVAGNDVRLLRDAAENYPAWLAAIASAEKYIHFESYIIHEDEQGRIFADALIAKAAEGIRVRVIYDWMGGFGKTPKRFWRRLAEHGIEVRCYNPFSIFRPLGWVNRDHRKILSVDGRVAFVTGLCVGQMWVGYPEKNVDPWRDTGVEIRGKAVADVERAFAGIWATLGSPLPTGDVADARNIGDAGRVALRVVASNPGNARIYRLDQLLGSMARESLWLTDAYFAGTNVYVETLRSAALDGVDVRLLVPAATDIPVMSAISRSGYRSLLEAGVRVYEWNGTMLHAKTAVIDGFWSRVGSTNLNIASWLTNAELDVLIEDREFGAAMQDLFVADLANATEIVLNEKRRARPVHRMPKRRRRLPSASGSSARYAPSAIVIGNALGASISAKGKRALGPMEAKITLAGGSLLLILGTVAFLFPKVVAVPLSAVALWLALSLFVNSLSSIRANIRQDKAARATKKNARVGRPEILE